MNCEILLIASVPATLTLSLVLYIGGRYKAWSLNQKIIKTRKNVWSPHGGGNQTTEIAKLAHQLTEKVNNNPTIVNYFGLAAMIITALASLIYTLTQINSNLCISPVL